MEKSDLEKCPRTGKRMLPTYRAAVKYARQIQHCDKIRERMKGSEVGKNGDKTDSFGKKTIKSIYVCQFCNQYHLSSTNQRWGRQ